MKYRCSHCKVALGDNTYTQDWQGHGHPPKAGEHQGSVWDWQKRAYTCPGVGQLAEVDAASIPRTNTLMF